MKKLLRFITALLAVILFGLVENSCDVHEFPDPNLEHDVVIELTFDKELPIHKTVEVPTRSGVKSWTKASDDPEDYDVRHIIQIYRADRNGKFDRTVFRRITFTNDLVGIDRELVRTTLPEGHYRIIAWTDHVTDENSDCFYKTDTFEEISLHGDHVGSNDLRDAFKGTCDNYVKSGVETIIPIGMERPMAKYTFLSTDFDEFRNKVLMMLAIKAEALGNAGNVDTKSINLDDFKVVFSYTGFMPSSYNLYTMKPADSKTGVLFETRMSQIDETHAELGFDYVFVNGDEGSVSVKVTTYDMDGNRIAETKPFEVPLMRSKHTIVKGKFLTTMSSGAIGIDPGFDGEFNVVIP